MTVSRPSNHLARLLGFSGDESSELGGRARKRCRVQTGEARSYLGIGQRDVHLLVQRVDDVGGVLFGAATPNQLLVSNSLMVGSSGRISERTAMVTARASENAL
jgi:hypothetical protein